MLAVGWSYKKVLVLNLVSSLVAFVGLYIGVPVSQNEAARQWIFAIAAGTFLYISLANIVSRTDFGSTFIKENRVYKYLISKIRVNRNMLKLVSS